MGFGQIPGYDLHSIVVTPGSENPTSDISPITDEKQPADSTLDIVSWNLSFLGFPSFSSKFKGISRAVQIDSVAKKLLSIDADVYALQEVVVDDQSGNALTDLLSKMNELSGNEEYGGSFSEFHSFYWDDDDEEYFPDQCLAYIWKKASVSVNKDSALLQNEAGYSDFAFNRLPYMLDANISFRGKTQRYIFVNIHLKSGKDNSERRASSMKLLRKLLEVNFTENNVVLLGDYNVADNSGAVGEIKDWGMYEDLEGDGLTDYVHVSGDKENGIDHILISNELYDELAYISEWDWNLTVDNTTNYSDHLARITSLYVYEESGNVDPGDEELYLYSDNEFTMTSQDYQVIVDYSNENSLNTEEEYPENSETYFGASAYFENFDIEDDGSWNMNVFSTWQEAIKEAISIVLLPAKFPDANISDGLYEVAFKTYAGNSTDGNYTFNFECTKSAPDPEFQYTIENSIDEFSAISEIEVYPNPANNILHISSDEPLISAKVYSQTGELLLNELFLNDENTLDISGLHNGMYFVMIQSRDVNKMLKILKK
jgi:endonuclease/exonuclease/phosphatase family metal-dependent hydrolase